MLNKDQVDLLSHIIKVLIGEIDITAVDVTDVAGFSVSTLLTPDMGYETVIEDKSGIYPVERYVTEELAKEGHAKWVNRLENGWRKVFHLPYKTLTPEKVVVLQPKEE